MNKITTIVRILLDQKRETFDVSKKWLDERIDLFLNTTYKSLEKQTYQNFKIWLFCGVKWKEYTENYKWPDKIIPVYRNINYTKDELESVNSDYMIMGRVDSDDVLRKDALMQVTAFADQIKSDKPEYLVMRKAYQYDVITRKLYVRYRLAPPFVFQVLPKEYYKNLNWIKEHTYVGHGKLGGRLPNAYEFAEPLVCVIKHEDNTIQEPREKWAKKEKFLTEGKDEIKTIMKKFSYGV